jgi:hypothetical protein
MLDTYIPKHIGDNTIFYALHRAVSESHKIGGIRLGATLEVGGN